MKKGYLMLLCGLLLLSAVGCGTVKGIGEDISTVGKWLTRSSNTVNK
jgi:predicted small secreted protein